MRELDLVRAAILVVRDETKVLARRKRLETSDINPVLGLDFIIVGGVDEGERKHAPLLQVRLVDTRKRADYDSETTKVARLESGVLTRRALTIVVVT